MSKTLFDRTALAIFKKVPTKAAQHLLFLAQNETEIADRWGYHIRPIHYYEPLPDFRAITKEQIQRRRNFPAIDFRWQEQLQLLRELETYRDELNQTEFEFDNDYFSGFDAAVYYALIRHLQPKRIIEIGGGYSTRLASKALARNGAGSLTCIEPFPERLIGHVCRGGTPWPPHAYQQQDLKKGAAAECRPYNRNVELITKRVEEIDVSFFSCLEANDILFIDSSHTVKFGSDVCYEFLEILPSLAPGVWVHVHDIFFPHDYPAEWLLKRRLALNEQYLLEAFLAFNRNFRVALSNYWLCLDHAELTEKLWPSSSNGCSSFWFCRNE